MGRVWLALALLESPIVAVPSVDRGAAFAFSWSVPDGCPPREDVIADIAAMADPDANLAGVAVDATITRSRGDYRLDLHVQSASGELHRELGARTCDTLARATALHVALAASTRPEIVTPPDPRPSVSTKPTPAPARARPQWRGAVAVAGAAGYGALPAVTAELSLSTSLLHPRFRIDLLVAHALPRKLRFTEERSASAMMQTTYGGARACPRFGPPKLDVLPCGGIEAGAMHVQGHGVVGSYPVRAPWLAIPVGLALAYVPHPSVAIVGRAELVVPVLRPAFAVEGLGTMMRVGPAHGRFGVGVELRFPRKRGA